MNPTLVCLDRGAAVQGGTPLNRAILKDRRTTLASLLDRKTDNEND